VKYFQIDIDEELDEELIKIAVEWFNKKQEVIDNKSMMKKLQGFLCF
jgi:hypothetical protein